jgi:antirestriction protein ArdC
LEEIVIAQGVHKWYNRFVVEGKTTNQIYGGFQMTNLEIIIEHLEQNGIDFQYDGNNLQTFAQWKQQGYSVKKGEKAFTQVDLWTMKEVDVKDENGKTIIENGKAKKEKKFYLKLASLFTTDQVEKAKTQKKNKKKVA